VGCSPGSVTTPAHLSQLPQDQKLSLAGLQLFLCSWKTGDRVSWPWLLHTLRTGVIKAPIHATHEHPGPWCGKQHSCPALQPHTSVFKCPPTHSLPCWQTQLMTNVLPICLHFPLFSPCFLHASLHIRKLYLIFFLWRIYHRWVVLRGIDTT
jgi:hypothetical protein